MKVDFVLVPGKYLRSRRTIKSGTDRCPVITHPPLYTHRKPYRAPRYGFVACHDPHRLVFPVRVVEAQQTVSAGGDDSRAVRGENDLHTNFRQMDAGMGGEGVGEVRVGVG